MQLMPHAEFVIAKERSDCGNLFCATRLPRSPRLPRNDIALSLMSYYHGWAHSRVGAQHAAPKNVTPARVSESNGPREAADLKARGLNDCDTRAQHAAPLHVVGYERIIRDEAELNETRRYISENPLSWETDEIYRP